MKTGNIGIRSLVDIGVADIDPYGTDKRKYAAFESPENVKLRIGVFFDGTGNNRFNSDDVYYNTKYSKLPLDENEVKKSKINFKSFVVESGSSYWNSYSNVALLHDLYEEKRTRVENAKFQNLQLKFYIEGIGTLQHEKDTAIMGYIGAGMGEGTRGVIARVEEACQKIADGIETALKSIQNKKTKKPLKIISIEFDVFGFSRGAAAARHFCNEVLKSGKDTDPENGGDTPILKINRPNSKKAQVSKDSVPEAASYNANAAKKVTDNTRVVKPINAPPARDVFLGGKLGELLRDKKIRYPKYNVSIEFLGLFDTVISQMLERKGILDKARNPITGIIATYLNPVWGILTNAVAFIPKVNPMLSNPNIKRILHLKAQTEWRDNFPFTPVGKFHGIYSREISVLGAHSDIGGAYWQTKEELHTLHFFDLSTDATAAEKQKLEQQKDLLRKWYISQKLCSDDPTTLYWETKHHVKITVSSPYTTAASQETVLMDESFMNNDTTKIIGNRIYTLQGYHYKLLSKRPLNNKLSLVYMNVMKYIALNYGDVPFTLPESKTKHPEEYKYPESYSIADNEVYELEGKNAPKPQYKKKTDLEKYQNLIIKIAEHGWVDKEGKQVTYPKLIDEGHAYSVSPEMYNYIMGKFVHLSANFDSSLAEILDHYNFAYANVPYFTNEKEYKNPPYERQTYTPELSGYDIS